jgi:NTP pyrophosphatase (non-canonical NTP hydrolase)
MSETQASISAWAEQTFGPVSSHARVAARANEEMAELLRCLTVDEHHPKAGEEIADVVIVLARLATRLGVDLARDFPVKAPARTRHLATLPGPFAQAACANEQLAILLRALSLEVEFMAASLLLTVVIDLHILAAHLGADVQQQVDAKMAVNRARQWQLDGSGHGYHVRQK